jgi:uncharacterized linocin/CFP29 family protein
MSNDPNVPWTDEQWARVNQVIQEEAGRARLAASFLPLFGPLEGSADFVRAETIPFDPPLGIQDRNTIQLATLQVKVSLRGAQLADPELRSALAVFRRAANVLGRLEDTIIFTGLTQNTEGKLAPPPKPGGGLAGGLPVIWEVGGGDETYPAQGLMGYSGSCFVGVAPNPAVPPLPPFLGESLVIAMSQAISTLESDGHFGPFAVVLSESFFLAVQTPYPATPVLPQDRIIPFLGGGPLLRSSVLPNDTGVVVALGGTPVELVVARDVSVQFVQMTREPKYLFRVREKMALRVKQAQAIVNLAPKDTQTYLWISPQSGNQAGNSLAKPCRVTIRGIGLGGLDQRHPITVNFGGASSRGYITPDGLSIIVDLPPKGAGDALDTPLNVTVTSGAGGANVQVTHLSFTYT